MSLRAKLAYRLDDFTSGVRAVLADETYAVGLVKEPLVSAQQVTIEDASGLLVRRRGHTTEVSGGVLPNVNSIIPAKGLPAGSANQLVLGAGANIYQYNVATGLSAAIIAGLTANKLTEGALAPQSGGQGPLYLLNGVEARYWTGAAAGNWTASAGTLPLGRFLLWHGTRMWIAAPAAFAGVADPGSTLFFSALGDPRNWPAANLVSFDPNDGERISGIGRIGPYLLVFKPSKTWLVYDLDTGANRQLSAEIGCLGHRTICETQKGTYFWTRDRGIAFTDGSQIKLVEDKLNHRVDFDSSLAVNAAGYWPGEYNSITSWNDRLYCSYAFKTWFGTSGFNGIHEYIPRWDSWFPHPFPSGFGALIDTAGWDSGDGSGYKLWGIPLDNVTSRLSKLFAVQSSGLVPPSGTTDFGAATSPVAEIYTRLVNFGSDKRKYPRAIEVHGRVKATSDFRSDNFSAPSRALDYTPVGETMYGYELPRPRSVPPAVSFGLHLTSAHMANGYEREFVIQSITFYADLMSRGRVQK